MAGADKKSSTSSVSESIHSYAIGHVCISPSKDAKQDFVLPDKYWNNFKKAFCASVKAECYPKHSDIYLFYDKSTVTPQAVDKSLKDLSTELLDIGMSEIVKRVRFINILEISPFKDNPGMTNNLGLYALIDATKLAGAAWISSLHDEKDSVRYDAAIISDVQITQTQAPFTKEVNKKLQAYGIVGNYNKRKENHYDVENQYLIVSKKLNKYIIPVIFKHLDKLYFRLHSIQKMFTIPQTTKLTKEQIDTNYKSLFASVYYDTVISIPIEVNILVNDKPLMSNIIIKLKKFMFAPLLKDFELIHGIFVKEDSALQGIKPLWEYVDPRFQQYYSMLDTKSSVEPDEAWSQFLLPFLAKDYRYFFNPEQPSPNAVKVKTRPGNDHVDTRRGTYTPLPTLPKLNPRSKEYQRYLALTAKEEKDSKTQLRELLCPQLLIQAFVDNQQPLVINSGQNPIRDRQRKLHDTEKVSAQDLLKSFFYMPVTDDVINYVTQDSALTSYLMSGQAKQDLHHVISDLRRKLTAADRSDPFIDKLCVQISVNYMQLIILISKKLTLSTIKELDDTVKADGFASLLPNEQLLYALFYGDDSSLKRSLYHFNTAALKDSKETRQTESININQPIIAGCCLIHLALFCNRIDIIDEWLETPNRDIDPAASPFPNIIHSMLFNGVGSQDAAMKLFMQRIRFMKNDEDKFYLGSELDSWQAYLQQFKSGKSELPPIYHQMNKKMHRGLTASGFGLMQQYQAMSKRHFYWRKGFSQTVSLYQSSPNNTRELTSSTIKPGFLNRQHDIYKENQMQRGTESIVSIYKEIVGAYKVLKREKENSEQLDAKLLTTVTAKLDRLFHLLSQEIEDGITQDVAEKVCKIYYIKAKIENQFGNLSQSNATMKTWNETIKNISRVAALEGVVALRFNTYQKRDTLLDKLQGVVEKYLPKFTKLYKENVVLSKNNTPTNKIKPQPP